MIRLPSDPQNQKKQSPEVIISEMCQAMHTQPEAYPRTRELMKVVGADTSFLQHNILLSQRGEIASLRPMESDREVAKAWFKLRLPHITKMKLIEGWVADNEIGVTSFMHDLVFAVQATAGGNKKSAKKNRRNS